MYVCLQEEEAGGKTLAEKTCCSNFINSAFGISIKCSFLPPSGTVFIFRHSFDSWFCPLPLPFFTATQEPPPTNNQHRPISRRNPKHGKRKSNFCIKRKFYLNYWKVYFPSILQWVSGWVSAHFLVPPTSSSSYQSADFGSIFLTDTTMKIYLFIQEIPKHTSNTHSPILWHYFSRIQKSLNGDIIIEE